jgi:hypothetical protein
MYYNALYIKRKAPIATDAATGAKFHAFFEKTIEIT